MFAAKRWFGVGMFGLRLFLVSGICCLLGASALASYKAPKQDCRDQSTWKTQKFTKYCLRNQAEDQIVYGLQKLQAKMDETPVASAAVLNDLSQNLVEQMACLLYTSPSPRDRQKSRMPSSA